VAHDAPFEETTMKNKLAGLALVAAVMLAPVAWAQDKAGDLTDMVALRAAVQADKKALVTQTLALTPAEAKKFWPAYEAYRRSTDIANRERNLALEGLIGSGKPMSDLYAKNLANALVTADDAEIKARRTLYKQVMKALPATKAARYLQLESKIRAMQAYDIAAAFPMIK
jgi:Spy/CpxP family protein refolding chaperone